MPEIICECAHQTAECLFACGRALDSLPGYSVEVKADPRIPSSSLAVDATSHIEHSRVYFDVAEDSQVEIVREAINTMVKSLLDAAAGDHFVWLESP